MGRPACTRLARRCSSAAACGGGAPLAVVAVRWASARCSSAASPSSGCLRAGNKWATRQAGLGEVQEEVDAA